MTPTIENHAVLTIRGPLPESKSDAMDSPASYVSDPDTPTSRGSAIGSSLADDASDSSLEGPVEPHPAGRGVLDHAKEKNVDDEKDLDAIKEENADNDSDLDNTKEGNADIDNDEEDNDCYRLVVNEARPKKISRQRQEDDAVWESFCAVNSDAIIKENSDRILQNQKKQKQLAGTSAPQSVFRDLMPAPKQIIHSPREYQVELFERCKTQNTIVVLDTGTGKTLIAALMLRHTLDMERKTRSEGKPHKTAFFLVDKVALVNQQHNFLQNNLDFTVAQYCGETSDSIWNPKSWREICETNMVVVCTAAILHKALGHSFVRISEINLLIFDEAHHAKKDHMYARIIKDFYIRERSQSARPRIMGMTASPVDGKEDIKWAAERLEVCLNSNIATVPSDMIQRGLDATGQNELVSYYAPQVPSDPTPLCHEIEQRVGPFPEFKRMFTFAKRAATEFGPWPADRFWHMCLTGDQLSILAARCQRDVDQTYRHYRRTDLSPTVMGLKAVLASHRQPEVARTNEHLSTKVLHLLDLLERSFTQNGVNRAIVFVEQRYTASILHDLLLQKQLEIPGVIPAILMGNPTSGEVIPTSSTMVHQRTTIIKFRNGDYTCLIATAVAEEGIDIPQCDLVVRFDLYNSMIQYVQSKGRARHKLSTYVNMAELGKRDDDRKIKEAQHAAQRLRQFCATVSKDRRVNLDDDDDDINSVLQGEVHYKQLCIQETGARLTFLQSLDLLSTFVSSLEHEHDTSLRPEYMVMPHGGTGGYICEVLLPEASPIRSATGEPQRNKKAAKCSAAFKICCELIEKAYIDKHLQPIFSKKLPAMRNARLAVSSNKQAEYKMTIKPKLWSQLDTPEQLYGAVLVLDNPDAIGRSSSPLMLLTRKPLPELPGFSLFFDKSKESIVRVVSLPFKETLRVTEADLEQLVAYTLNVFRDVFSKVFEASAAELPYFIAPSNLEHGYRYDMDGVSRNLRDMISWGDCASVVRSDYVEWTHDVPDEFFEDRFIIDQYDGSRKFFTRHVDHNMTPDSELPSWMTAPRFRVWNKLTRKTPMEYSNSVWDRYRYHKQWKADQRVIESELIPIRRNLLDEHQEERPNPVCWLVLEPLRISTLRAEAAAMALTFPTIIYRIESHLITLDACKELNLTIHPSLALEAMTKDSDNSDDHGEEQINFQAGMGSNYERLEFLGDTFLKMATTISLFSQEPTANEFEYHVERMVMICNKNLFNTAVDKKIQEHIRTHQFDRNSWYPLGLKLIKGKKVEVRTKHPLGDKTIADVCEALIGAAYLTHVQELSGSYVENTDRAGEEGNQHPFDMAVRAVTAFVRNKKHRQQAFADYYTAYNMPEWQKGPYTAAQEDLRRQLGEATGYIFASPSLARSAFKHPSYPYESVPHYQRLEFLGDSLLDMVCVEFLYGQYPGANPQWLTEHKMAMVSNQFLGCLGVKLGFHRHILTTNSALMGQIREYANELEAVYEEGKAKARAEAAANNSTSANAKLYGYWLNASDPPKAISDVVEAFIGAIFVDSRYNFARVRQFFDTHIRPFFVDMALYDSFARKHPVTAMAQLLAQDMGCARWRLMTREVVPTVEEAGLGALTETRVMCGVLVHGKVLATAVSASGRYAKVAAAKKAFSELHAMSSEQFRAKMGCDCTGEEVVAGGDHGTPV